MKSSGRADLAGLTVGETIPVAVDMARARFFAPGENGAALA